MPSVNLPWFTGGWFVQRLSDHIEDVQVCIEGFLCFCGGDVSDGAEQAAVVIPIDPFQRFPLDVADGFPGAELVDDLRFEDLRATVAPVAPRKRPKG